MREYHYKCKMMGRCKYAYFLIRYYKQKQYSHVCQAQCCFHQTSWEGLADSLTHTLTWAETDLTSTTLKIHKALHKILQVKWWVKHWNVFVCVPSPLASSHFQEEMKLHALEEMLLKMWVWPLVKLYQNHCNQCQCHWELYLIIIIIIHAYIMYYIMFYV